MRFLLPERWTPEISTWRIISAISVTSSFQSFFSSFLHYTSGGQIKVMKKQFFYQRFVVPETLFDSRQLKNALAQVMFLGFKFGDGPVLALHFLQSTREEKEEE